MFTTEVAIVTGANRGIGKGVCRQLAQKGYHVVLTSRDIEKGKAAVKDLKEEGLEHIYYQQLDVSKMNSIEAAKHFVEQQWGYLNVLVNNAGINYDTWQTADHADLQQCQNTIDVNLFGPWRTSQAFLPLLLKNQGSRIVNVSSGAGSLQDMTAGRPGYAISKAALNALTLQFAKETESDGLLVNAVCPGWVRTDMGGEDANRSIAEGAASVVWAATLPEEGPTAGFFRDGKALNW